MDKDLQPVIIGVGQQTWRERDVARTPVDALQAVATKAASDTGSSQVLAAIDAVVHIPFLLNQVPHLADEMPHNPGAALAQRLGIDARQYTSDVGGNLPQQLVNDFAGRVQSGEVDVALICGVELLATFLGARRGGESAPDWATGITDDAIQIGETPVMTSGTEFVHGLYEPVNAYPLFESALRHADGLDGAEHQRRLGSLVSAMSQVAAGNEYAWKNQALTPEQVLSTDDGNRMISVPYTKYMNAVLAVDQAAAVILTTAGKARELGVDEEQWIYLRGAAGAHDPWFLSERESFTRSPALRVAADSALTQSGLGLDELTHFDLYSCFPSAVQVACRELGLSLEDPRGLTVTGGLTLFGGPGNNYSLHAIAQMVDCLRATEHGAGLVSANGGYLTKHAVGVYSREAGNWQPGDDTILQRSVDARVYPSVVDEGRGDFTIEAHTLAFKRSEADLGILIGRLGGGERCIAVSQSPAVTEALLSEDCVGRVGQVTHRDGQNHLEF